MRILFLDDDPLRGEAIVADRPDVVWVRTAEECLARLVEDWDEVHLDHDLGGETFVDHERDDCGMAVVRWLCEERRGHLQAARFVIHSHNPNAACIMAFQLQVTGYRVEVTPFERRSARSSRRRRPGSSLGRRFLDWLRR
jgi:hypothetical protein